MPAVRFIYLTTPQRDNVVLNITSDDTHTRYRIDRSQLFRLNEEIVEILIHNKFDEDGAQLVLSLEKAATP